MRRDSFLSPSTEPRPLTVLLAGTAAAALGATPSLLAFVGDVDLAMVTAGAGMAVSGAAALCYALRDRRG